MKRGLLSISIHHLFSENEEARILSLDKGFEELGDGEGEEGCVGGDVDGSVCAHGEAGPESVDALGGTHADGNHLGGFAGLLDAEGLLQSDFAEGVHRHLHVLRFYSALISSYHKKKKKKMMTMKLMNKIYIE